jgi:hypothetical protein
MDGALAGVPPSDWEPAQQLYPRPAARLYLPGSDCVYTTTTVTVPPDPNATTLPPETTPDGSTIPTEPPQPQTQTVLTPVRDTGTTVPQFENVSPTAPLPTIAPGRNQVGPCGRGGTAVASATTTTQPGG